MLLTAPTHQALTQRTATLTSGLATALPTAAVNATKYAMLDAFGVALGGWDEPVAGVVLTHAMDGLTKGPARVIGSPVRLSAPAAALVNGTLIHALDFDDTTWAYIGHPSAVLLPAALAAAEETGARGGDLIAAYVVGFEVASRLGRPVAETFASKGWHLTSTIGIFGAAAAAAHIRRLASDQTATALAIAASFASGLKANFGSMVKPLHAGLAARGGVEAAALAAAGCSAAADALESPLGFYSAFGGPAPDCDASSLAIVTDGITLKRFPSCTGTHPAIEAVLALRDKHAFTPASIERIVCRVTPEVLGELIYEWPSDATEARFSMGFAVALALVAGDVQPHHFTDSTVAHPAIRDLISRCEMVADPALVCDRVIPVPAAEVAITLVDGRILVHRVQSARGNPDNPLDSDTIIEKFERLAIRRLGDLGRVQALREAILNLEEIPDVRELTVLTITEP